MILLSEIDHRRVLDGARVPLCWHITDEQIVAAEHPTDRRLLEDTRNARIEWCGDIGWREEGAGYPPQFFREPWGAMALDPAHPDVARLLDRKIAEALNHAPFAPSEGYAIRTGFQSEWAQTPCFLMAQIAAEDGHTLEHECLHGIAIEPANIPAGRAALIRALYPAVKA